MVIPTHNIHRFTWDGVRKTLVAAASDFARPFDGLNCGTPTMVIENPDTGGRRYVFRGRYVFIRSRTIHTAEGEIRGWEFIPELNFCPVETVVIFND